MKIKQQKNQVVRIDTILGSILTKVLDKIQLDEKDISMRYFNKAGK